MAKLASLWIGSGLGPIEQASARSFIAQGDELIIYCYAPLEGVPEGVKVGDANEILPAASIVRHKRTGSPALHSDIFRYALIAKTDAIWVDLDIISLKPFVFQNDWVLGYESPDLVNGAVLKLPKNSETLYQLSKFHKDTRGVPPHIQGGRRLKYMMKSWMVGGLSIDRWPWGAIGPAAITHFLKETGEIRFVLPQSAFYKVAVQDVEDFLKPAEFVESLISEDVWALHLWGKELRAILQKKYDGKIPKNSFLEKWVK